jgi:hypothetical protein
MATCKDFGVLEESDDKMFDALVAPDTNAPHSGIYRCKGCGAEVTGIAGLHLPPHTHHLHESEQGKIQWQLVVAEKLGRSSKRERLF